MISFRAVGICGIVLAFVFASSASAISINEIRIDQNGTNNDEYFELAGMPSESLGDLTYLVIGDVLGSNGPAYSGSIECVVSLSGLSIPSDGYFLAAKSTFSLGGSVDLTTSLNFENSDNVSHFLVKDFTGALGDDLDTDNDGTLDVTPWSQVVDSIALVENTTIPLVLQEWWYGPTVGPDGANVPYHVYRQPNGSGSWQIGIANPTGPLDTPGTANLPEPITLALFVIGGLMLRRRG